jgi:hypothetical protein
MGDSCCGDFFLKFRSRGHFMESVDLYAYKSDELDEEERFMKNALIKYIKSLVCDTTLDSNYPSRKKRVFVPRNVDTRLLLVKRTIKGRKKVTFC